jgi:hypothetical protein
MHKSGAKAWPPAPRDFRVRRVIRFGRIVERFDLVAFRKIADWAARDPSDPMIATEERRHRAYRDLLRSIGEGELGPTNKPCIAYLPRLGGTQERGRLPLRLTAWQVSTLQEWAGGDSSIGGDLWTTRALAKRWLIAHGLRPLPEPLSTPKANPTKPTQATLNRALRDFALAHGGKLKQGDAEARAMLGCLGANWRQITAAFRSLPSENRYARGKPANRSGKSSARFEIARCFI